MNLVKEKQGGLVPTGLKRWPFKLIKHFADATGVSPSPAGPAGCCPCFRLRKKSGLAGFYTKLNVWGSLGLIFDYDWGPIIENGDPIFLYMDLP